MLTARLFHPIHLRYLLIYEKHVSLKLPIFVSLTRKEVLTNHVLSSSRELLPFIASMTTHLTESRHCYWSDNLSSQTCLTILLKCDIKLREAFCSVTPSPLKWTYLNVVVTVSVATRKTRFYFMQGLLEQVWEVSMSRSYYWLNKNEMARKFALWRKNPWYKKNNITWSWNI